MPPKKSDQRKSDAVNAADATSQGQAASTAVAAEAPETPVEKTSQPTEKKSKEKEGKDVVTVEDLSLPKSIITRLAKGVLPPNTQIQANAILAMSKSATVFISYLAAHANENTVNAKKKTVSPADVFKALDDTEFSFLKEPLEAEFAKFNAIQTEKRTSYRKRTQTAAKSTGEADGADTDMADASVADSTIVADASGGVHDQEAVTDASAAAPRSKKQRVDPAAAGDDDDDDDEEVDAETEEEDGADDDDDDDEDGAEEDAEEQDEEEGSGDETQDALEDRDAAGDDDGDEALDGDESD